MPWSWSAPKRPHGEIVVTMDIPTGRILDVGVVVDGAIVCRIHGVQAVSVDQDSPRPGDRALLKVTTQTFQVTPHWGQATDPPPGPQESGSPGNDKELT